MAQLSHPYVTTGKTIGLTRPTFVGKVMSLLFNMLSRLGHSFPSKEQTSFSFMAAVPIWSDSGALKLVIADMWGSFCNELRKSKPISSKIQIKNKAYAWKNPASYTNFYGQEYLLEFRGKWFISVLPSCFWEFLWKKKVYVFLLFLSELTVPLWSRQAKQDLKPLPSELQLPACWKIFI